MNICVIGTGYVGLVTGTCFAEMGNDVICADVDTKKVEMLRRGRSPIYEPGLEELIRRNLHEDRLRFTTDTAEGVRKSLIIFIAVGTPCRDDGSCDLSHVFEAASTITHAMKEYKIVVLKSTVQVGTADKVRELIRSKTSVDFDVVSNPEFLKEGAAIDDFMRPDRVVIGAESARATEIMKELYRPFVRTGKPIIFMDNRSAELTKYAANAMLATRISFINEIANVCECLGANVNSVREGIGSDERIGFPFLFPGVGYGGSCFPKDVKALASAARDCGYEMKVLEAVDAVNTRQKSILVPKIRRHFNGILAGKIIALWGLSFKPRTDDMREAPSISIVNELLSDGVMFQVHDPVALKEAKKIFGRKVEYCEQPYDALEGAHAMVLVTEWAEFRNPDFDRMQSLMAGNAIFDGRNIYNPKILREKGFVYYGIGQ
ncbi:MAG: UDP-glucose/GDP-mannose dehydrogenase family protein [Candidatus Abyssobacteria bacterium SURF_17]|uniref:UDP-glucose 6-dehydrogenase n=1 Tax=Candidatus Abyssobacteria bacterium SURF_17 TaxID=2093361 RepID=A0A419EYR5_9BACT|nr:MAG: UDP-glucose/GDP-mannose dehydrogenase family protein [Candidatus Abyssubacteria bacterium SURF_17]